MTAHLATVLFDGARRGYRHYTDEDLHRACLAVWREQANAAEALPGFVDAYGEAHGPVKLIEWCLALGRIRDAIEAEEAFRERARARGVPRDDRRGWVPAEVVAAIKARLGLPALILSWGLTDLRPLPGGRWVGRCPFHDDATPSFYVFAADPADQHFHCHGCLVHGDVFTLAREHGPWLSFREAAEGLAGVAGVDWPPPEPARRGIVGHVPAVPDYLRIADGRA